jgi:hypothetical protein
MGLNETDRAALVKLYWDKCQNALIDADGAISIGRWNISFSTKKLFSFLKYFFIFTADFE